MAFFKNVFKKDSGKPATKAGHKDAPAKLDELHSKPATIPVAANVRYEAGMGVLVSPHITEKTVAAGHNGTYTLRLRPGVNKLMVRRAIEDRYGVSVVSVRIVKAKSKIRRIGRRSGVVPGFTKAMVTLVEGQSIELGV